MKDSQRRAMWAKGKWTSTTTPAKIVTCQKCGRWHFSTSKCKDIQAYDQADFTREYCPLKAERTLNKLLPSTRRPR